MLYIFFITNITIVTFWLTEASMLSPKDINTDKIKYFLGYSIN